ncbi:GNAT family N-acetyltransferase [Companilactobacillus halodurans]|uniref:GNAT family N-acetyltransferase n=1 Tax=Companilactobacillus halodurans TaxID=2584183 RepID=A0A5P0ZZL9_9LACO|nr:GNAT family N-acetyltransferase [Companilactobacillus halodurans]MQS76821.1 GNAT family N-acetyltransferase [Companilactobacillus halodurans]MQS98262.1 GNAT family N-acetyltransferase [Companilactobacillus halodurans]
MLRYARKEDADQILPILFQIFDEMELDVFKEVGDKKMAEVIKEGFFQPGYRYGLENILVNEIDGKVVAIMVGYPEELEDNIDAPLIKIMHKHGIKENNLFNDKEAWPGEWYLDSFAIAPEYQGKGIGTKTMEEFIDVVKKRGEKILSLNVDVTNEAAKHVYDKTGFKKVGQLYIGSHLYDHMQYDLTK